MTLGMVLALGMTCAGGEPPYDGRRKCVSCHKSQAESWEQTAHARAMESLAPGEKAEAKRQAGLDPDEDYTGDPDCVGCHTTGYGRDGGYEIDDPDEHLADVGCEACHGPGSVYRRLHRKHGDRFERHGETFPRAELVEAGQDFEFEERCNACHLNYAGSSWPGAREPYTPFTPEVDPKYRFEFERAVRDDEAMHAHFKLGGTYVGEPLPPFHEEFQRDAQPLEAE